MVKTGAMVVVDHVQQAAWVRLYQAPSVHGDAKSAYALQVLADVIASGAVSVVRLTEVFRQAAASRIIVSAHRINQGSMPDLSPRGVDRSCRSRMTTTRRSTTATSAI